MKNGILLYAAMSVVLVLLMIYILADVLRRDTQPPQILLDEDEITVSVHDPKEVLLQGVTARDEKDGDLTGVLVIESVYGIGEDGRATVKYAVADRAGSVTKAERTVVYRDYTSPRLELTGALVFEYGTPFDVLDYVRASDLFEGDISRRIKTTLLSDGTSVGELGVHDVQFRVTNAMGDTYHLTMPVEVYPVGAYNAALQLREYLVVLPVGAEFDARDYALQMQVQKKSIDLDDWDVQLQMRGEVDTQTPGVYSVTYLAECWRDGYLYTGYSRLVVVVEE